MTGRAQADPGLDARREQMLRAAVEVINERGFAETRITDVARRTSSSPALVLYYFGTKDGLLTEALRYAEDLFYGSVDEVLETLPTGRDKLEHLVRATCVKHTETEAPNAWGIWLDLWVQAFRHPEVARNRVDSDRRWSDTIARVVREGQAAGEFGDVDVDDFCIAFAALLDGLSVQVALEDEIVDSSRALAVAMGYAAATLGFAWGAEPTAATRPSARRSG